MTLSKKGKYVNNLLLRERNGKVQVLRPTLRLDSNHVGGYTPWEEFNSLNNALRFASVVGDFLTEEGRRRKKL
jgi:hypothetical protein